MAGFFVARKPCHPVGGGACQNKSLSWGRCQRNEKQIIKEPTINIPMEAIEFLVALFIVFTLPDEKHCSQLTDMSTNELGADDQLSMQESEEGDLFKIAGMWLNKSLFLK